MFEDHKEVQTDEYETDSDDDKTVNEEHLELVKSGYTNIKLVLNATTT